MENNEKNKTETRVDRDGNMQVRSSGARRTPVSRPTPRRSVPTKPTVSAPKTAQKTPAEKKPDARTVSRQGVEYSFANTGLFGNSDSKVKPTAAQEARKTRESTSVRDTNTRVVSKPAKTATRPQTAKKPTVSRPSGSTRVISTPRQAAKSTQAKPAPRRESAPTRITPTVKSRTPMRGAPRGKARQAVSSLGSVASALLYIAIVMIVSIILSIIAIKNANDVFAFVKDEKSAIIEIDTSCDLNELASSLKELGIIKYKNTFKFYTKFRHNDSDAYTPGSYTVSSTMNYDQLIKAITPTVTRESVVVTVPEGFTCEEIIDLLVEKGVGSKERYIDVIQNYDFDYWFVKSIIPKAERYYRLEGYLFPDTYYFFTDSTEETVIDKFLQNFDNKFNAEYKEFANRSSLSMDEIITLASMIQAEGKGRTVTIVEEEDDEKTSTVYIDYGMISSVFHNRLAINMPMQSDATTQFALDMEHTGEKVTGSTKNFENPYNTYNFKGLPPGAICNPGLNAISFALWPDSSKFYYFLSDSSGATYFSETLEEHQQMEQEHLK